MVLRRIRAGGLPRGCDGLFFVATVGFLSPTPCCVPFRPLPRPPLPVLARCACLDGSWCPLADDLWWLTGLCASRPFPLLGGRSSMGRLFEMVDRDGLIFV